MCFLVLKVREEDHDDENRGSDTEKAQRAENRVGVGNVLAAIRIVFYFVCTWVNKKVHKLSEATGRIWNKVNSKTGEGQDACSS